jgi:hypothetical protein
LEKELYGKPVVPSVEKEDRMSQTQDTIVAALMEQLIAEGPEGLAHVFTTLFNLAMRLERERFLGAGLYERHPDRRGYAQRLQEQDNRYHGRDGDRRRTPLW